MLRLRAVVEGVDLRHDVTILTAGKRARLLAATTKVWRESAAAISPELYNRAVGLIKDGPARLLLQLTWSFAARLGDLRQVQAGDLASARIELAGTRVGLHATFRYGKGATFWGPYTIASAIEASVMKELEALRLARQKATSLWTKAEQAIVSRVVRSLGLTDVKSIRRGRLQALSALGASTEELRLLSGHKRVDTLLRYLGWGKWQADALRAAQRRTELEVAGAGKAPKMGRFIGRSGESGQRVRQPPQFLQDRPPTSRDLGLKPIDTSTWPLKAHATKVIDWEVARPALVGDEAIGREFLDTATAAEAAEKLALAQLWLTDVPLPRPENSAGISPNDIPHTNIKRAHFDQLRDVRKIRALKDGEPILGWAQGHLVPQLEKEELRPVFDCGINRVDSGSHSKPEVSYPARRVRRYIREFGWTSDFDFHSWFDQLGLETAEAETFYVCRFRILEADGSITEELGASRPDRWLCLFSTSGLQQ